MDIFNNREWALIIWATVFVIFVFYSQKMDGARSALKGVISAFFSRQIQSVLLLMIIYMSGVVYILIEFNIWNVSQLKNTIVWCVSVGFMSIFKLHSIQNDKNFFTHSVIDNFKLIAVIEFVIGVYTFHLLVEIILLPILVLIGAMTAISDSNKKYHLLKSFIESMTATLGFLVIAYATYMLITNFGEIAKEKTIYDFTIPPLLTFLFFPFIFFMVIYSSYEQAFVRLRFLIKNTKLRLLAMLYSIVIFNFRIRLLERWITSLTSLDAGSYKELNDSIKRVFVIRDAEKSPVKVPYQEGWSPYLAKNYLVKEGFDTGYYNKSFDGSCALSKMIEINEGSLPNNIAYYVEGNQSVAKTLKLMLNVNNELEANTAHAKLLEISNALSESALNRKISAPLHEAIVKGIPLEETFDKHRLSVQKNKWSNHKFNGYDIKFIISIM